MASVATVPSTRRFDPERRQRIIEAALVVVNQKGINGLTFRAVASQAEVPLGSTSYHFADKDELLEAVVHLARERSRDKSTQLLAKYVKSRGLAGGIAKLIEELTTKQHDMLVLDHDLYLSAMHQPKLQEESRQWSDDFVHAISAYTDDVRARAIGFMIDGICLQSALLDTTFSAQDVEPLFSTLLTDN